MQSISCMDTRDNDISNNDKKPLITFVALLNCVQIVLYQDDHTFFDGCLVYIYTELHVYFYHIYMYIYRATYTILIHLSLRTRIFFGCLFALSEYMRTKAASLSHFHFHLLFPRFRYRQREYLSSCHTICTPRYQ